MHDRSTRRAFLAAGSALAAALAGCPSGTDDESTPQDGGATPTDDATPTADGSTATDGDTGDELELGATEVATGLGSPVDVVALSDGSLVVAEQPGRVARVADGTVRTLLDLRDSVVELDGYTEQGLLGVEPHPSFAENGRLFVRYSAPPRGGTPEGYSHTFVLSEFAVDPEGMTADPDSERTLLEIPEPQSNHNAGPLAFGPEGLLYVPVGDGGAADDQGMGHVSDWYDPVDGGNGQDTAENLLGSLLRIDVNAGGGVGSDRPYGIPDDNPLVGSEGLDEHFAWGLRNPWGISFGPEGRLFVADVGQESFEEINVVERGGNYGWNVREGPNCFQAQDCPSVTPDGTPLVDPIVSYPHSGAPVSGVAVVGGHLYDGSAVPSLQGRYVFGDWQWQRRLFVARERQDVWTTSVAPIVSGDPLQNLLTIGRGADGELLVGTSESGTPAGDDGAIHRITQP